MPDSPEITANLVEMYSRNDLIMRVNFRIFLRLSGLDRQKRSARIVDCGCGLGHLLKMLAQSGFNSVVGLDASTPMVSAARLWSNLPVLEGNAAEIGHLFPPSSLDVVIASDLLHHFSSTAEWDAFLSGCFQVLRPGGRLIMREPFPNSMIRLLMWLAPFRFLHRGFLKARLNSFLEEADLLEHFFSKWVGSHHQILARHGFSMQRECDWLVHRISIARRRRDGVLP